MSYQLERPIGGKVYHLNLKADLRHAVDLEVDLTCPDLTELGPWHSTPPDRRTCLDGQAGRLALVPDSARRAERVELDLGLIDDPQLPELDETPRSRPQRQRLSKELLEQRSESRSANWTLIHRPPGIETRRITPFSRSWPKSA